MYLIKQLLLNDPVLSHFPSRNNSKIPSCSSFRLVVDWHEYDFFGDEMDYYVIRKVCSFQVYFVHACVRACMHVCVRDAQYPIYCFPSITIQLIYCMMQISVNQLVIRIAINSKL